MKKAFTLDLLPNLINQLKRLFVAKDAEKVFIAVVNTTSFSAVKQALSDGKIVIAKNVVSSITTCYQCQVYDSTGILFTSISMDTLYGYVLKSSGWEELQERQL